MSQWDGESISNWVVGRRGAEPHEDTRYGSVDTSTPTAVRQVEAGYK